MSPAISQVVETAPDVSNLAQCVDDARLAALDGDSGPAEPSGYPQLLGRLEAARETLPPLYHDTVFVPFVNTLQRIGQSGYTRLLMRDPQREGTAGLMLDIAQAILQNGEGYAARATDAFEEVVSDLYDGFLSAEDRRGVNPPDKGTLAPLVKWGNPDFGPYTFPVDATGSFGVECAIVSLPPANARRGLLAWAALGHETAGHDILDADTGLKGELVHKVQTALQAADVPAFMPEYWASRIDETASDVLGILNMGPAAGIGLIGYFRGLNAAFANTPHLRNVGPAQDPHPADILRGFLAASVVRLLRFRGAASWAKIIEDQTHADVTTIRIEGERVTEPEARESARVTAEAIVLSKLQSLEHHALGEIQNWRTTDERIVTRLRRALATAGTLSKSLLSGAYASHVVAAAVMAALVRGTDITLLFDRMLGILKAMHDGNPSWGPLFVRHPGSLTAHRSYMPLTEDEE